MIETFFKDEKEDLKIKKEIYNKIVKDISNEIKDKNNCIIYYH